MVRPDLPNLLNGTRVVDVEQGPLGACPLSGALERNSGRPRQLGRARRRAEQVEGRDIFQSGEG